MRTIVTIGTMSVLFLGIFAPGGEKTEGSAEARSQDKRSTETVAAKPNKTAITYASSDAGDRAHTNQSRPDGPEQCDSANAEFCLDFERPPTPVQECARSILQEKGWTVPATKTGEGRMMATRKLTSEELRRVAHTEIGEGRIHWEEGMVNAEIRLIPLSKSVTQARIRTRILANGSTSLPLMRPSPWWPLVSTGSLEGEVCAALKTRCFKP